MRNSLAIYADLKPVRDAVVSYREGLPQEILDRLSPAQRAELEASSAAYLAEQEARLAALRVELLAAEAVECQRCSGTGVYQAPSSRRRNGVPVCFACHGSGQK